MIFTNGNYILIIHHIMEHYAVVENESGKFHHEFNYDYTPMDYLVDNNYEYIGRI